MHLRAHASRPCLSQFPYFGLESTPKGWKNSVRHNLSLSKFFVKIERPEVLSAQGRLKRQGAIWGLELSYVTLLKRLVAKQLAKYPRYPSPVDHIDISSEAADLVFAEAGGRASAAAAAALSAPSFPRESDAAASYCVVPRQQCVPREQVVPGTPQAGGLGAETTLGDITPLQLSPESSTGDILSESISFERPYRCQEAQSVAGACDDVMALLSRRRVALPLVSPPKDDIMAAIDSADATALAGVWLDIEAV